MPANATGWFPSGDVKSNLVYQGSITVPDLCGGGEMRLGPASFAAGILASSTNKLHFRWHYNADAKGGGWSATYSVTPDLLPF